ncbi:hypothetical protein HNY73_000834 [Argiope bruennichi]|uniref:Uncharacterized protein n=1 Tax=Argiope bruennichi TaxID=94029 RepID=A0A8T0FZD9_ARGBR|nr:hypothetical protein HNY73_000834 [Argiope bruennichi]
MNDVPANRQAALLAPFVTSLPLTGSLLSIILDGTKTVKLISEDQDLFVPESFFWKYDRRHPAPTAAGRMAESPNRPSSVLQ